MPQNFKSKPMSKLWSFWNDIPATSVTSKDAIRLLLLYARKHCQLRFPGPSSSVPLPSLQNIVTTLQHHEHDHVDADGCPIPPIPNILLLPNPELRPTIQHLCWNLPDNHPLNIEDLRTCTVHILAPGLSPLTGIHHFRQILHGVLLVFEWPYNGDNFVDPFLWDPANPML
ncbi:hypothetical protein OC861_006914, partial [Tilletia horrida]